MEYLRPYYHLDLPTEKFLVDGFVLEDFSHRDSNITAAKKYQVSAVLNREIINFFSGMKMTSPMVQIFCSKPGDETSIHIDGQYTNEHKIIGTPSFAINYIINGENSEMSWYHPNIEKSKVVFPRKKNPFSVYENINDLKLIDTATITKPSIVRIDIPHQVRNFGNLTRWAVSLRFPYNRSNWKSIIHQFDAIIKK
jgi:hypothetical protein